MCHAPAGHWQPCVSDRGRVWGYVGVCACVNFVNVCAFCVCICVCICVCACVCVAVACMCARERACPCACVSLSLHACVRSCT